MDDIANDIRRCTLFIGIFCKSFGCYINLIPKGSIDDTPTLIQIMYRPRRGEWFVLYVKQLKKNVPKHHRNNKQNSVITYDLAYQTVISHHQDTVKTDKLAIECI